MVSTGIGAYRKAQIATASPLQLVIQLYDGAIRFTEQAIRACETADREAAHAALIRGQAILTELRATLNLEAGEVGYGLNRVYELIYRQLLLANLRKDPVPARIALASLQELADAWQQVARQDENPTAPENGAVAAVAGGAR